MKTKSNKGLLYVLIALVVIVLFCLVCALPFMSFQQEVDQVMQGYVVREGQREEAVTIQLQGTKYIKLWSEDAMAASIRVTDGDGTLLFYGSTFGTPMPANSDYVWSTYCGMYNTNREPDFDKYFPYPNGEFNMLLGWYSYYAISGDGKYLLLDDFRGEDTYLAAAVDGASAEDCAARLPDFFDQYCAK